jgi:hypothetical protein
LHAAHIVHDGRVLEHARRRFGPAPPRVDRDGELGIKIGPGLDTALGMATRCAGETERGRADAGTDAAASNR